MGRPKQTSADVVWWTRQQLTWNCLDALRAGQLGHLSDLGLGPRTICTGKVQVHQNHFHQKIFSLKIHFHQKTTFIKKPRSSKNHVHQKTTFIKNHFHQRPLSSKTNFIRNQFHQKPFSSETIFIRNHFHQKPFSSEKMKRKGGTVKKVSVCVKASPAEGRRRLHTNTAYARFSGFNRPSCGTTPAKGRRCST